MFGVGFVGSIYRGTIEHGIAQITTSKVKLRLSFEFTKDTHISSWLVSYEYLSFVNYSYNIDREESGARYIM